MGLLRRLKVHSLHHMELVDVILHRTITVKLTSGLLFEFQHIKCMDTDVINFGQECESITDNESLMCFSRWNHVEEDLENCTDRQPGDNISRICHY